MKRLRFYFLFIALQFNLIENGISISLSELGFGLSHNHEDIHFYLHPSESDHSYREKLIYQDADSLSNSSFKKNHKTVILIHGFWSNSTSRFPTIIKKAYLKTMSENPRNYIVVDWGLLGTSPLAKMNQLYPLIYAEVVATNIPMVSRKVANFIKFLQEHEHARLEEIHIVGHSLGSHVAGMAGHLIHKQNGGKKIHRITGLDPAGPLFDGVGLQRKLRRGDADFVDVYHTATGTRGSTSLDGHVDFYPNGGYVQPGCKEETSFLDPFHIGSCSHEFVVDIFAATIRNPVSACKCNPQFIYELLNYKKCLGTCKTKVVAGEHCPPYTRGQYFFEMSRKEAKV